MPALNNHNNNVGEVEPGLCAGCGGKIIDRYYLLAVDKQWHAHCLKCSCCHVTLDSELTCFAKDGHIFCKEDYYRFAVKRCARCDQGIGANELVMRARDAVYHLQCFACISCNKVLNTGDHFGMKDHLIFCKLHYDLDSPEPHHHSPGSPPAPPPGPPGDGHPHPGPGGDFMGPHGGQHLPPPHMGGPGGFQGLFGGPPPPPPGPGDVYDQKPPPPVSHAAQLPFYNGVGAAQKGRPRKRKSPLPAAGECHDQMGGLGLDHDPNSSGDPFFQYSRDMQKQKRMRTSFKHHQLRAMKAYFSVNHNPDAKDLKQLSEKTGLPKKVLQVWFQNARAKYRRNLLKTDGGKSGGGDPGAAGDAGGKSPKDGCGMGGGDSDLRSPLSDGDMSSSSGADLHHSSSLDSSSHMMPPPPHGHHGLGDGLGGGLHSNPSLSELFSTSISASMS